MIAPSLSLFRRWSFATVAAATLLFAATTLVRAQAPKEDDRPVVDDSKEKKATSKANPMLPSLFLVGDSTVRSGGKDGMFGWGEEIAAYFDTTKLNVLNHAIGGRSSRTFITDGRWDKVLAEVKRGDTILVQFGHNDVGDIGEKGKFRGSLKSTGEETEVVTKTDGTKETVHSFGWYLRKYVTDAQAKGATIILCTPVPHKKWQGDFAQHSKWVVEVAKAKGVSYLPLTVITGDTYTKLGAAKVEKLFADKGTHTTKEGADINAQSVIAGLKTLKSPLAAFFSEKGRVVPAYAPAGAAK